MFNWSSPQDAPSVQPPTPQPVANLVAHLSVPPNTRSRVASSEATIIGKGMVMQGEIIGTEALLIEGRFEGNIQINGNRVTVSPGGSASATIVASVVVVLGEVQGSIYATDRVDVRPGGVVTGDVIAPRICIEPGAFLHGEVDTRTPDLDLDLKKKSMLQISDKAKRGQQRAADTRTGLRIDRVLPAANPNAPIPVMSVPMTVQPAHSSQVH